ncbi:MAG: hypothetical protein WCW52_03370 [Elusimicrobiales bacterium]|jgi:hypothetical protein
MKMIAMIVCLLGLTVGTHAEMGTENSLIGTISESDIGDKYLADVLDAKLAAMFETGSDATISLLADGSEIVQYSIGLTIQRLGTDNYKVSSAGNTTEVSGSDSSISFPHGVYLEYKVSVLDGKTYLIQKQTEQKLMKLLSPFKSKDYYMLLERVGL